MGVILLVRGPWCAIGFRALDTDIISEMPNFEKSQTMFDSYLMSINHLRYPRCRMQTHTPSSDIHTQSDPSFHLCAQSTSKTLSLTHWDRLDGRHATPISTSAAANMVIPNRTDLCTHHSTHSLKYSRMAVGFGFGGTAKKSHASRFDPYGETFEVSLLSVEEL